MELKVIVDNIERSVSGVTPNTTCSQIIYALAHATTQRGKFVMIEKFRNIERRLSPNDRPLETLLKWREHAAQVTFLMKKLDETNFRVADRSATLQSYNRNPSTSSVPSQGNEETTTTTTTPVADRTSSTSISVSTLPRRPPPPDYQAVMEQKCALLSQRRSQDVSNYVDVQRVENWNMTDKAKIYEDLEYSVHEEELNQLLKQQKNLRAILEPMMTMNWPQLYQQEVKKSHKLRASIEATKEAVSKTRADLAMVLKTEKDLENQLDEMTEVEVLETSIDLETSMSPQKMTV